MKNLMDLEFKSSFKYQLIFSLSAAMHITFFLIFVLFGLYILAAFNIISILFYIFSVVKSRGGSFEKHSVGWIVSVYSEITAHAVLCTLWLGFESCFFMYSMVVLTIAAYVLYLAYDHSKFLKIILPFAAVTFATLIGTFIFLLFSPPVFTLIFGRVLNELQLQIMRGINIFFNTFIIFFFAITFIAEMNVLLKKLNEANEQLNFIADHDPLTGLYNRRSFYRLFDSRYGASKENSDDLQNNIPMTDKIEKKEEAFCVIMGDIDNFKKINDTYGHSCGDEILKSVSEIIIKDMKEDDIACRWGGEEFLIIMKGGRDSCYNRIEDIRGRIENVCVFSGSETVGATMTFGFTSCFDRRDGTEGRKSAHIDDLVRIADDRLYLGKNNGKNIVVA